MASCTAWKQNGFHRAVTETVVKSAPRRQKHGALEASNEDSDLESDLEFCYRRAATEPTPTCSRINLVSVLDAVDSKLPCPVRRNNRNNKERTSKSNLVNALLCMTSLLASCLFPVLVDLSKTATVFGPNSDTLKVYPYTPLSLIRAEAVFNVFLGLMVLLISGQQEKFAPLVSIKFHLMILPLSITYCIGDLATMLAIGNGGGPLYIAVGNSKLFFAAGLSHTVLGRRQSLRQWTLLVEISAATVLYAALSTKGSSMTDMQGFRAMMGIGWAVLKAFLSGAAAVLTECRYKTTSLWHANTILKAQSLGFALIISALHPLMVEDLPVCSTPAAPPIDKCIDHIGWDRWTWAVLAAAIGTGWLSVAVLTRMSAIAKFVCKTATAPVLYIIYCCFGWGGLHFEIPRFIAVIMIVVGICGYTVEPHLDALHQKVSDMWVVEYPRSIRDVGDGASSKCT